MSKNKTGKDYTGAGNSVERINALRASQGLPALEQNPGARMFVNAAQRQAYEKQLERMAEKDPELKAKLDARKEAAK